MVTCHKESPTPFTTQCFQTSNFVWRCRQGLTRSLGGRVESCASADPIAIESATSLTQRKGRKLTTSWADDKSTTAERCPAMRIHASLPPVSFGSSYPCLHSKMCGSGPTVSCDFPCVNIVDILLNCTFFFFYLRASSWLCRHWHNCIYPWSRQIFLTNVSLSTRLCLQKLPRLTGICIRLEEKAWCVTAVWWIFPYSLIT